MSARDRWERERMLDRDDDSYYRGPPPSSRPREHSDERFDRRRPYDDDYPPARDRPRYHEEERFHDDRYGPPLRREPEPEYRHFERRAVVVDPPPREPTGRDFRDVLAGAPRRPVPLRRQSSLDTFDRGPPVRYYEREEYPAPARREDVYRTYREERAPDPLPRARQLPSAGRTYADYEDIKVAEPDRWGDDEFRSYPDRVTQREYVGSSRRRRSRDSHTTRGRRRSPSRSSYTTSSRSSSSSSGGTTVRSEYPKKGKTKIPARLVSIQAMIDLGYPFTTQGNQVIIQKALGQDNIDELLKLSEQYKKAEAEAAAPPTPIPATHFIEGKKEETVVAGPPPVLPTPAPPTVAPVAPAPAPVIVNAAPPPQTTEIVRHDRVVREVSPPPSVTTATSSTSSFGHYPHHHHHHHGGYHHHHDVSDEIPIGAMALAPRHRSRSRTGREIRAEIRALEAQLKDRKRGSADLVHTRSETLPDGSVVFYEEKVDRVEEGYRGARIERDKKGRMSLSIPKR